MANPDYLGFSLANILDLLRFCLECEEFSEYSENSCENMANYVKLPVDFMEYLNFSGYFMAMNIVLQILCEMFQLFGIFPLIYSEIYVLLDRTCGIFQLFGIFSTNLVW